MARRSAGRSARPAPRPAARSPPPKTGLWMRLWVLALFNMKWLILRLLNQHLLLPASISDACGIHSKAFQDCLNSYGSDISKCQFYLDMLSECKRNSGVMGASS
ncbi:uncharacterized protein LOC141631071 [Silene latifolia]|uniref:uncharacterized protein LOC141631071 n=1 Tax=Silene latifolia TaxID=37657 RepID=UPI003D771FB3